VSHAIVPLYLESFALFMEDVLDLNTVCLTSGTMALPVNHRAHTHSKKLPVFNLNFPQ
jgi:hypothetical protein